MKKYTSLIFLLISIFGLSAQNTDRYSIIPQPQVLIPKTGEFIVNKKTTILVDIQNDKFKELADNFVLQIQKVSGINIPIKDITSSFFTENVIVFQQVENLPSEGYELFVTSNQIIIKATKSNGLFYGIQTLYQLLPIQVYGKKVSKKIKWKVPCCSIKDSPRFSYRGMMLDTGRHFMPKEFIMKLIDIMSMHKQNMFHWHLTEDQGWRIEIKKYPKLTEIGAWRKETSGYEGTPGNGIPHGGFYTQEDIKEVIEYARQRYVNVIPEVEMPGHASAAIAAYPELSCFPDRKYEVPTGWGIKKNVFCPNAKTFQFLEDVFSELIDLFPSPYYHIGGDECPRDNWKKCNHCQDLMKILDLKNEDELQIFFVERMERYLREKFGKKVIGWDEIIDGGAVPNTIVMAYRGHARAIQAANQNQYTILTPNRWSYLDYYQEDPDTEEKSMFLFLPLRKVYNYDPIPASLSPDKHKYILGHQGSVWTEYIQNPYRAEYMMFPRAIAMSEVGWCSKENKNWNMFQKKMLKEFQRLDQKKVNYSRAFYNIIFHYDRKSEFPKKVALTLDYPESIIRYTIDGSEPTWGSAVYFDSITVNDGDVIKAKGYLKNGKQIAKMNEKQFKQPEVGVSKNELAIHNFSRDTWMWGSVLINEDIQKVVNKLKHHHINRVFLLVKGASGAKTPEVKLKEFINKAHAAKIDVHFWYIVNSDKQFVKMNPDACIYHCPKPPKNNNPYPVNDERINLLYPGYKKYVMDNIRYYLKNFDCDGIHLDYIRYAHFVYSFDKYSLKKAASLGCDTTKLLNLFNTVPNYTLYAKNKGFLDLYTKKDPNVVKWVEMRKEVVSDYIKTIKSLIQEIKPEVLLSAAFMPEGAVDVDFSDVFYAQNYALHSTLLDIISPMAYFKSYGQSTDWMLTIAQGAKKQVASTCKVCMGIQNFDGITAQQVDEQIHYSLKGGADGIIVFRYGTPTSDSWMVVKKWGDNM